MKYISWNVNGLRACMEKGFTAFVETEQPDIIALQETKMQQGQAEVPLPGYYKYWNSAEKKGYSGTAIFTKELPLAVTFGIGSPAHDAEGRAITLEYPNFYFVTVYTPNAQDGLKRLGFRMLWEDAFCRYLVSLDAKKPVIICGDFNVAHQEIDLKNPGPNRGSAGFSDEERAKMTALLSSGFTDTFRKRYPDTAGAYSWWSYRYGARSRNAGWRIDYFLVSDRIDAFVTDSEIMSDVLGSDHCPVCLRMESI